MAPLKACLVVQQEGQHHRVHYVTVQSYQDLQARSASKAGGPHHSLCITATGSDGDEFFEVNSEAAFQALEQLYRRCVAEASRIGERTARVRLVLRCQPQQQQQQQAADEVQQQQPMSSASRAGMPCASQQQQAWDEAALMSIKRSVALWHFGSRMQHLAA